MKLLKSKKEKFVEMSISPYEKSYGLSAILSDDFIEYDPNESNYIEKMFTRNDDSIPVSVKLIFDTFSNVKSVFMYCNQIDDFYKNIEDIKVHKWFKVGEISEHAMYEPSCKFIFKISLNDNIKELHEKQINGFRILTY